jgi:hypothetical protein
MQNFLNKLFLALGLVSVVFASCKKEDFDTAAATDFPPGILRVVPGDGGKVVLGDFDISVYFVDGTVSPLSSGTVRLTDAAGTELAKVTETLSGTSDSIVIDGASFNASSLGVGIYTLNIDVTDSKGQTTSRTTTFELSTLPFAANNDAMWIAGEFNGWGGDQMTLVGPYTWEVQNVTLNGGPWKFKNCLTWCDTDWGDEDCDGIVSTPSGNSLCSPTGLYHVRFNDQTLRYEFVPAVTLESNIDDLYLLGSFNNFEGTDYHFALTGDHTWVLDEILLKTGDRFKFAEGPNFMGDNWGDAENDGIAELFGPSVVFNAPQGEAYYKLTFNDQTLVYTVEFVKYPSIGIIGSATPGGWDNDTDLRSNGDGTFSIVIGLTAGAAKFRANDSWDTNWGASDFPTGTGTQNGPDIPIATPGLYTVTFTPSTGEYKFEAATIGIIGDATPGGWGADTDLTPDPANPAVVTGTLTLTTGEAKFRANDDWKFNWGGSTFPTGTGTQDGPNIPVTAGTYTVTFNVNTGEYSFQ